MNLLFRNKIITYNFFDHENKLFQIYFSNIVNECYHK